MAVEYKLQGRFSKNKSTQQSMVLPQTGHALIQVDVLKTVDTIGNCQRLAFTVGVSQHMHTITNL